MKKKIINGILLVALIFATSSAFVSCKDNDSDVKTELYAKIATLQQQINDLKPGIPGEPGTPGHSPVVTIGDNGNWFIDGIDTGKPSQGAPGASGVDGHSPVVTIGDNGNWFIDGVDTGKPSRGEDGTGSPYDDTNVWNKIAELEAAINDLKGKTWATQEDIDAAVAAIQTQIDALKEKIDAIYKTQVTSLNIDAIKNPVFGFVSAPVDVQSNLLMACYGKATSDVEFPVGSGEYIAFADDLLTLDGYAGKLYVTVNPSSVDFSGKTLTLESTSGKQAPVTLSPLVPSEEDLLFGWTRAANAFYEATAKIPTNKLSDVAIDLTKQDLTDLKDDVIYIIKNRKHTKRGAVELLKDVYDLYTRNMFSAYRLKATWGENNYSTFSETKIAALAVQPLSYSFDPEGAISVKELEKLEDEINEIFEIDGSSMEQRVNKFWDKFNKFTLDKVIGNINYALQPCLLVQEGKKMSRARYTYSGEILLVPTSRTAEVFSPAYKKYIEVKCDGEIVEGELLNKVIDGTVLAIPLKLEPGKKYDIEYQAVDYTGVVRVNNYTIYGK